MARNPRPKSLIPTSVPIVVLILMGAGFWIVRPQDIAVAEQFINTDNASEALLKLERLREKSREPVDPNIPRVEARLARERFESLGAEEQRRFWIAMLERRLAGKHPESFTPILATMVSAMKNPAGLSTRFGEPISAPEYSQIADALVARDLGASRPDLAAELIARCLARRETVTTEERLHLANIRLQAGLVDAALHDLDHIPRDQETAESTALRIRLLRATGDNREAAKRIAAFLNDRTETASYEELELLIQVAREGSEFEDALETIGRFVEKRPYDTRLRLGYSSLLADARFPDESSRQLAYALGSDPTDVAQLRRLVMLKEWAGDITGAQNARVRLAVLNAPGMVHALHETRMAPDDLHSLDKFYEAVSRPGREADLETAAEFFAWMGRYDEAKKLYRRHLAHRPEDRVGLLALAVMLEELGDVEDALPLAKKLVALAPDNTADREFYARLLLATGRRVEALEQLSEAGKRGGDAGVFEKEIALAQSLGMNPAAAAAAKRMVAYKKQSAAPFDLMRHALFARESGDFESAEDSLRRVLKTEPTNDDARRDLAVTLAARGNFPDALDELKSHSRLKTDPELSALYMDLMRLNDAFALERAYVDPAPPPVATSTRAHRLRLAALYAGIRNLPEAIGIYERLHQEKPGDLDVLEPYLVTLMAADRRAEALELSRIHIGSNDAKSLRVKARVSAEARNFAEAAEAMRALVQMPGESTEKNYSMLGDIELSAGKTVRARQAYAAALRRLLSQKSAEKELAR